MLIIGIQHDTMWIQCILWFGLIMTKPTVYFREKTCDFRLKQTDSVAGGASAAYERFRGESNSKPPPPQ